MADWLTGWAKRRALTISHNLLTENVTNLPVLIRISSYSGVNSKDLSSIFSELGDFHNSQKIAVTLADGTTQIYAEICYWDSANNIAGIWVSSSSLILSHTTDTILYLYYDHTQSNNTANVGNKGDSPAQKVWESNFKMVHNMNDTVTPIKDSTINAVNGAYGSHIPSLSQQGKIFKSVGFDGSDDMFSTSVIDADTPNAFTIEAWVKTTFPSVQCVFPHSSIFASVTNVQVYQDWGLHITAGKAEVEANIGTTTRYKCNGNVNVADGQWHHVVGVYAGANGLLVYVDGILDASIGHVGGSVYNYLTSHASIGVGDYGIGKEWWYNGLLEGLRYSTIARSAGYIKADYLSQSDALISYGDEETSSQVVIPSGFTYKKKITISPAAEAGTNYQICIIANYGSGTDSFSNQGFVKACLVYLNSHSLKNFGDVRFLKADGTTELPYCMVEKVDGSSAIFWVKIPDDLSTNPVDIYIVYGNSSATTTSSMSNTFVTATELVNAFLSQFGTVQLTDLPSGIDTGDGFIQSMLDGQVYICPCLFFRMYGGKKWSLSSSLLHIEDYDHEGSGGSAGIDVRFCVNPVNSGWQTSNAYPSTTPFKRRVITVIDYVCLGGLSTLEYMLTWNTPDDIPAGTVSGSGVITSASRIQMHYGFNTQEMHVRLVAGHNGGINIFSFLLATAKYVTPEPLPVSSNNEESTVPSGTTPFVSTLTATYVEKD